MRSAAAMLHEASTTKSTRLADRRTRTFFWKSCRLTTNASLRSARSLERRRWKGAAVRNVASKARSSGRPTIGRDTDVTAAFALGQRETALAGRLAREFVQGSVKPFGLKVGADLDLAARLRAGVGRLGLSRVLFLRLAASRCVGWFC